MFKFIKQIFISSLVFFSSLSSVNPLEFISIKNQDLKLLILIVMILYFILLVLRQINVVVIAMILMIHMQEFAFLIR